MLFQNYLTLEGRLTRDPVLCESKNKNMYCTFGVCYNEIKRALSDDGKTKIWKSTPHFFNCVIFGNFASDVAKMKKGELVSVTGSMNYSHWTKNGENHSDVSIHAQSVKKLVYEKKNKDTSLDSKVDSPSSKKDEMVDKQNQSVLF